MKIAMLVYDRFTALEVAGPLEVLSRLPGAQVSLVAARAGLVRAESGAFAVAASLALADMPRPDVVVVSGGAGHTAAVNDPATLSWLREANKTSRWTASVGTGSLILAAAGLLAGRQATTHWLFLDQLAAYGVRVRRRRVVVDGRLVTAGGVSAGIDMALELAALIAGRSVAQAIELLIEYDPRPPFGAGSPNTAPASTVMLMRASRDGLIQTGTVDLAPLLGPNGDDPHLLDGHR